MASNTNGSINEFATQLGLARHELDDLHLCNSFSEPEVRELLHQLRTRLIILIGNDRENLAHWMRNYNLALKGVPLDLIQTPIGFQAVMSYLDWFIER